MQITVHSLAVAVVLSCGLAAQAANQGIKRGPWSARHAPEGWVIHETDHYQVQSEAPLDKAKRLGSHMESMLAVYTKLFPTDRSLKQFAIKLFKDRESFMAYGAPPSAGAYYSPVDREMVCYDSGKWQDEAKAKAAETGPSDKDKPPSRKARMEELYGLDILGAAAHEGWHQYFHRYVTSWVELPSWINEGMGDYLYCAVPKEVTSRKAVPAELGAMNSMRLPIVRMAVKEGSHVAIADLVRYSKEKYYREAGLCYAQGWALCQFLLHSDNARYRQVIPTFVKLVKNDTNMTTVTDAAFKGIDMNKLEEDWKAWVLAARLPWEKAESVKKPADGKAGEAAPGAEPTKEKGSGAGK